MVIEADGGLFAAAGFLRGFAQRVQAGFYRADGGEQSENSENNDDPEAEAEPVLKPYPKVQKKQGGEDDGKTELAYPHQKTKDFHIASGKTEYKTTY